MTFDKRKNIRTGKKKRRVKQNPQDNIFWEKSPRQYVGSIIKHRSKSSEILSSEDINTIPGLEILSNKYKENK